MSKKASQQTQLTQLRREFKLLHIEADRWAARAKESEKRWHAAEAEVAEWKARFDKLLSLQEDFDALSGFSCGLLIKRMDDAEKAAAEQGTSQDHVFHDADGEGPPGGPL